MTASFLSDVRRASRRDPCPICEKPDRGCFVRLHDERPACAVVPSDRPLNTVPPTWLHGDDDGTDWRDFPRAIRDSILESRPDPPDPDLVDRGLRALFAACPLTDGHRSQLHRRGLSDDDIAVLPLGSLTDDARDRAAAAIVAELGEVAYGAVPGLYRRFGRPALAGAPGLLVGVPQHGRLVGAQIRPDDPTTGKYVWLSSPPDRYQDGCGSGAPLAVLPGDGDRGIAIEGALKGLIVNVWTGLPVVAMPGVGITSAVPGHLADLGVRTALTAVDWDREEKPEVAAAEDRLFAALRRAGFVVERLTWPRRHKGLDDALAAHALPLPEPIAPEPTARAERSPSAAEARHLKLVKAVQATGLAAPEKQSIIALFTHIDAARTDDPTLTEFAVPNGHIAEHVGVSDQTAGRHLDACQRLADRTTGEVIDLYTRRVEYDPDRRQQVTIYAPHLSLDEVIDLLPRAVPLAKDGTPTPKRGHGGARQRACPDHPEAAIIRRTTVTYHCAVCDREVDRDRTGNETVETPSAVSDSILESGARDGADRATKNPSPLETLTSGRFLESGQTYASPLPGFEAAPLDPRTDVAFGRRGA